MEEMQLSLLSFSLRTNSAVHITQQPRANVINSFNVMNNESVIESWQRTRGCFGCAGTSFTTLTDQRLLTRFEECLFCKCMCEPARTDSSIYLRDIARLSSGKPGIGWVGMIIGLIFKGGCCECCREQVIIADGPFMPQAMYMTASDAMTAKQQIWEAIIRQKGKH